MKCQFFRLQKPITDELLYISHIENSRFIYLHSEYHKKTIEKLEKHLFTKVHSETLPQFSVIFLYIL